MGSTHSKLIRGISRWTLVAILVGVVIAALMTWANHRKAQAGKRIDAKLAALRAAGEPMDAEALARMFPLPPPELDAAILLNEAIAFITANPTPGNTPLITGGPELNHIEPMDAQSLAMLRRHYDATADVTNVMPVLPRGARFGENWSNGVLQANVPIKFVTVRIIIQMLSSRALCAAEIGDAEGATAMLERSFRFTAAVPKDSTLVSHMIYEACLGLVSRMTERCLNKVQMTDAQLARVLDAMPPPSTNHFLGTFRVEHCMAVWAFNEIRSGKHFDDVFPSTARARWWERTWRRLRPVRNEYNDQDFLAYLDLMPQVLATTEMPARRSISEASTLLNQFRSNATCRVAESALPNWTKALEAHYRIETHLEVTRLALAVERFRAAHRRLPESLEETVPALIPSPPLDPFDGKPLRFKSNTRGYVVYSIGQDGIDQGGVARTNQYAQTNYDITVTVER